MTAHEGSDGARERAAEAWRPAANGVVACFIGAALLAFGGSFAMRWAPDAARSLRIVLALAPLPALAGILWFGVRAISRMDELERRIQAEALAIAFGVLGLVLVGYGQLQQAGVLGPERWTTLWPVMLITYCAGWVWSARRYRGA
ncbi:MAG TPA: hypothetical protein VFF69_08100 [Phycisphaerales bacterium]|nr:hypothetical protein [Phycisphaerales bacterium]